MPTMDEMWATIDQDAYEQSTNFRNDIAAVADNVRSHLTDPDGQPIVAIVGWEIETLAAADRLHHWALHKLTSA